MLPLPVYPLLTEQAIEFLEEFLSGRSARVLEFGAGSSTVWLASRVAELTAIEHSPVWVQDVRRQLRGMRLNATVIQAREGYATAHEQVGGMFDLVLIDGRDRPECIEATYLRVACGGVLMLDNAERPRYAEAVELLASWQHTSTKQVGPRALDGFGYPGWKTDWWRKP